MNPRNWEEAESIVAKLVKGKVTVGSGRGNDKGDVKAGSWAFEIKWSNANKISVKKEWLEKLERQCKNNDLGIVCFCNNTSLVLLAELRQDEVITKQESITIPPVKPDGSVFMVTDKNVWLSYGLDILKDLIDED